MLETFVNRHGFYYVIAACCIVGMLGKWYEGKVYKRLLRALDSTDKTEQPFIKQLRLKYLSYRKLNYTIHNMDAFIENQLYRYKERFFRLESMHNISSRMMLLCIMASCAGVGVCVYHKMDTRVLMYHIVVGALGVAALQWVELQFGSELKRKMLFVAMKDYLENVLANRATRSKEKNDVAVTREKVEEKKTRNGSEVTPAMEKTAKAVAELALKDATQEKVIADVIQEFFP